ncbi:hypothetical protein ABW20_dc0106213 [Dactylellina cionopaga]|nr:hypothetical protein ABW20_dc0106213 [Dactylellina cionopaga]
MTIKPGDKSNRDLSPLRSKLTATSLQSTISETAKLDVHTVQCCHKAGKADEPCGCTEACWDAFAAILCRYNIHDNTESTKVSVIAHAENEQISATNSSSDLSFTSENSDSQCSSSSCQSFDSHSSDDHLHHDIDVLENPGNGHHHSYHFHHHGSDDGQDPSSSDTEKRHGHDYVSDNLVPEALRQAFLELPHALVTQHHHHYLVQKIRASCSFHQDFATQKHVKNQTQCACAWIKGTLLLVFENTQFAQLCCRSKEEGYISTRACCLEDHNAQSEIRDSIESLPSEVSALIPAKALRNLSLSVSGMTCTSCETKLTKALRKIEGVIPRGSKGVKTNFMQGRADIWYDSTVITDPKEQICDPIRKLTGFKCKVLRDTEKNNGDRPYHTIRVKISFTDDIDTNAIQKHINLLKGVEKVTEISEHEDGKIRPRLRVMIEARTRSLEPDLEKGMVGRKWKFYDVKYDQQSLYIRNLLQYIRTFSRPKIEVELADIEEPESIIAGRSPQELHRLLWLTILAALLTLPILIITWTPSIKTQVPAASDMDRTRLQNFIVLHSVCFVLASVVQVCGLQIYKSALRSVFWQRRLDMDCLITISTTAAYVYSCVYFGLNIQREARKLASGNPPKDADRERHDPIFEASTLLITLILAGRLLTGYIRHWAANRISVGSLQERFCQRSSQTTFKPIRNRRWKSQDVRLLHYGDVLLAQTGDVVVTDGVVVNGEATVDESHLTGEASPAQLQRNSTVIAGSKIIEGKLDYRVTRLIPENTISAMKKLVNAASGSRPKVQEYADRVATCLTPIVLAIAIIACGGWLAYYRTAMADTQDINSAISKALTVAITVLAISCPCAIALAVPTVLIFSAQVGVKNGIVIKSPSSLEKATKIRYFVADKTGTLTTGKLQVAAAKYWVRGKWVDNTTDKDVREIQLLIYKLIARDRHPVARAVFERLSERHTSEQTLSEDGKNIRSVVGKGIEGLVAGRRLRGGKPSWVLQEGLKNFDKSVFQEVTEDACRTPFVVVDVKNDTVLAIFGLADTIRPEAASVIKKLQDRSIECFILSGDQKTVCMQVAEAVGIPSENVYGECSPEDKAHRIRLLQTKAKMDLDLLQLRGWLLTRIFNKFRTGRRYVLFLGDGTNDAPALTQADIGVTMSNCTDIAAGCADAGILSSSLNGVTALLALSKRAMTLIKCNFSWALKYNLGAILLSIGVIPWGISPQYAGVGEAVSVAPVFIIASSILWWKLKY